MVTWKSHNKSGALAGPAVGCQRPAVALDNLAAHGQPDAGPLVNVMPVKALKRHENSVQVFLVEPDAVVLYGDATPGAAGGSPTVLRLLDVEELCPNGDNRGGVGFVELDRISDQILQELSHLGRVGVEGRQVAAAHVGSRLFDQHLRVGQHFAQ